MTTFPEEKDRERGGELLKATHQEASWHHKPGPLALSGHWASQIQFLWPHSWP